MWLALKRTVCFCVALKRAVCFCCYVHHTVVPRRPRPPRPRTGARFGGGGISASSLSDDTSATCLFLVFGTDGRGVVMSWQRSAVKGRISSKRPHCRFASSRPFGLMTYGIVGSCGRLCRKRDCSMPGLSTNYCTRTVVDSCSKWK